MDSHEAPQASSVCSHGGAGVDSASSLLYLSSPHGFPIWISQVSDHKDLLWITWGSQGNLNRIPNGFSK